MIRRAVITIIVVFTVWALFVGPAIRYRDWGHETPLPLRVYCAAHREECRTSLADTVASSPTNFVFLSTVNDQVNRSIVSVPDGPVDVWDADGPTGDCDDYVLTKRRRLLEAGYPSSALLMYWVQVRETGEGHLVLAVNTTSGVLILDNLVDRVYPVSEMDHVFRKRSTVNPLVWTDEK